MKTTHRPVRYGFARRVRFRRNSEQRAVQLDPNLIDARSGLISFYLMAPGFMGGSEEKALEQAQEIRKRDPIEGHRAVAGVYARQKKKDLAYMPKDEPGLHRAWYWRGQIYEKTGRKAEAKQSYATSLRIAPGVKDVTEALKRVP